MTDHVAQVQAGSLRVLAPCSRDRSFHHNRNGETCGESE